MFAARLLGNGMKHLDNVAGGSRRLQMKFQNAGNAVKVLFDTSDRKTVTMHG